jgi:hypothetical protein
LKVQALVKNFKVEGLLTTTAVFTETFRAYPWLILLSSLSIKGWAEPPLSFLSALAVISVVTVVLSVSLARGLHLAEVRIGTLSLGMIAIILLTRLENGGGYGFFDLGWFQYASTITMQLIASVAFGVYLMWRGITISREELGSSYLYRNFAIGIGGFIFLTVVWAATQGRQSNQHLFSTLVPYIVGYFFAALMGMGIANFLSLREGIFGKRKATDLFARRWLLILLGVVGGIVIVGSLLASALSLNLVAMIIEPLNKAAGWLATGFLWLLGYPLGYLVEGIGWVIQVIVTWLLSRLHPQQVLQSPEWQDFADNANKIQSGQIPETLFNLVKWIVLLALLALVIYLLGRAIFRYWRGNGDKGYEEINESLWSWGSFKDDLNSFLRGLTDRFRRSGPHVGPPLACTITEPQLLDIRELYRGLLWEGAASGHPKYPSQTPYEYRSNLQTVMSGDKDSIEVITAAYVKDRYGHIQPSDDEGMSLVRTWLVLRSAMRSSREGLPGK